MNLNSEKSNRLRNFDNIKCSINTKIIRISLNLWPSWLRLQNTPTASLQRAKAPPNGCPGYDITQSDGEAQVMVEFWGMLSTSLLPSFPHPLWHGVVAPDLWVK